jgi:DNA-binding IclR family transcriptional regulator
MAKGEKSQSDDNGIAATEGQSDEAGKLGIQSIEIGMQLMATLVEHAFDNPPPMLKTLAANAGMPSAKAHRYMVSLVRSQLVERDTITGRYRLGPMARLIGLRAIQSLDVVKVGGARLPLICADVGFSVALAIWAYDGPTIIAVEEARRPITIGTRVGEIMPLLTSATGQVFGAWMPATLTRGQVKRDFAAGRSAGGKPPAEAQIERIFKEVRQWGVGLTRGGVNATVNAVSAPIFDHRGVLVAALSTLGPANELDADPEGRVATAIRHYADTISGELGYTPELAAQPG